MVAHLMVAFRECKEQSVFPCIYNGNLGDEKSLKPADASECRDFGFKNQGTRHAFSIGVRLVGESSGFSGGFRPPRPVYVESSSVRSLRVAHLGLRRSWKSAVGWVEPRLVAARPTMQAVAIVEECRRVGRAATGSGEAHHAGRGDRGRVP